MDLTIVISVLVAMVLYEPLRWVLIRVSAVALVSVQWVIRTSFRQVLQRIGRSRLWRDAATKADLLQEQAKQ